MSTVSPTALDTILDTFEDRVLTPVEDRVLPRLRRGQAATAHRLARHSRNYLRTRALRTLPVAVDRARRIRLLQAWAAAERLLVATRRELHIEHAGTARHAAVHDAAAAWCCRQHLTTGEQTAELATALSEVESARQRRRPLNHTAMPSALRQRPQVRELLAALAVDEGVSTGARQAQRLAEQLALDVGEHAAEMVRTLYVG